MRLYVAAAATAFVLLTGIAHADRATLTADAFLSACTRPDPDWIDFCHGYVQGIFDTSPNGEICPPSGATRAKLVGLIVQEIADDPDLQAISAATHVRSTLQKAYPCR